MPRHTKWPSPESAATLLRPDRLRGATENRQTRRVLCSRGGPRKRPWHSRASSTEQRRAGPLLLFHSRTTREEAAYTLRTLAHTTHGDARRFAPLVQDLPPGAGIGFRRQAGGPERRASLQSLGPSRPPLLLRRPVAGPERSGGLPVRRLRPMRGFWRTCGGWKCILRPAPVVLSAGPAATPVSRSAAPHRILRWARALPG